MRRIELRPEKRNTIPIHRVPRTKRKKKGPKKTPGVHPRPRRASPVSVLALFQLKLETVQVLNRWDDQDFKESCAILYDANCPYKLRYAGRDKKRLKSVGGFWWGVLPPPTRQRGCRGATTTRRDKSSTRTDARPSLPFAGRGKKPRCRARAEDKPQQQRPQRQAAKDAHGPADRLARTPACVRQRRVPPRFLPARSRGRWGKWSASGRLLEVSAWPGSPPRSRRTARTC